MHMRLYLFIVIFLRNLMSRGTSAIPPNESQRYAYVNINAEAVLAQRKPAGPKRSGRLFVAEMKLTRCRGSVVVIDFDIPVLDSHFDTVFAVVVLLVFAV